jgi:hypothetical protein
MTQAPISRADALQPTFLNRRRLTLWLGVLGGLYLAMAAGLALTQRAIIYPAGGTLASPADVGLPTFSADRLTTADGEIIPVWRSPAKPGRVTFLYLHGNADTMADRAFILKRLTARGDGVVAIDYRGWPGATGTPSEAGLLKDAEAAWDDALRHGVTPERMVIVGESLGGGPAVALAATRRARGLILDSTFASMLGVTREAAPWLPVSLLLRDHWRSDERIGAVRVPLLQFHGDKDAVVSFASGQSLFERAHEPKRFRAVKGAGHMLLADFADEALDWVERLPDPK